MSPLWPLFPGTLLLLAAPGGARADSAPAAARSSLTESKELLTAHAHVDERSCGDDDPRPKIAWSDSVHLYLSFGDDITIFCSSNDASNLTILDVDHQLQAELLNSTTIQVTLIKPNVGEYKYHCTDSITSCTDTLVHVYVHPAISVTAPHVRQTRDEYDNTYYFVNRNDNESSYNIYCSAQQTPHLYSQHVIRTNFVNSTTLMATVSDHTEGERAYYCEHSRSTQSEPIGVRVYVIVDYYPEARDFRCVFYRSDSNLECSWKSTSKQNTYTLSILRYGKFTLFCIHSTSEFTASCKRTLPDDLILNFILSNSYILFQLETCNTVFCSNQTFQVKSHSITKLVPVRDLKVVNTSPQGATVAWLQDVTLMSYSYKVEYRLLGTDWRAVNASIVRCEDRSVFYALYSCELQLALPCPDAHYELRVYIRYEEATLDLYWSEPATVFFFTAPSTGGEVDPACGADFREVTEKPPTSAAVVLYKVKQLISDERKEKQTLKKFISGLNNTLAEIKVLMDAQN